MDVSAINCVDVRSHFSLLQASTLHFGLLQVSTFHFSLWKCVTTSGLYRSALLLQTLGQNWLQKKGAVGAFGCIFSLTCSANMSGASMHAYHSCSQHTSHSVLNLFLRGRNFTHCTYVFSTRPNAAFNRYVYDYTWNSLVRFHVQDAAKAVASEGSQWWRRMTTRVRVSLLW